MDTWELAAREAIRDTVAAYAHYVDAGRFDELVALFTANGEIEVGGVPVARGHEQMARFYTGVGRTLQTGEVPQIRHHTSNLRISLEGPTDATGECYFLCVTERGVDHWGRYRDRYRAIGTDWRFAHRSVRTDGWVEGGWVAGLRAASADQSS